MITESTNYRGFSRVVTYILYANALKECFDHLVWTNQGFWVFLAVTVTVVRYFLTNVLFEEHLHSASPSSKIGELIGFWLSAVIHGGGGFRAQQQILSSGIKSSGTFADMLLQRAGKRTQAAGPIYKPRLEGYNADPNRNDADPNL